MIDIRWTRTGSQPYRKIMYSILLQTIFRENENKIIKLMPILLARAFIRWGLTKLVLPL